jgi:hypothetical protein
VDGTTAAAEYSGWRRTGCLQHVGCTGLGRPRHARWRVGASTEGWWAARATKAVGDGAVSSNGARRLVAAQHCWIVLWRPTSKAQRRGGAATSQWCAGIPSWRLPPLPNLAPPLPPPPPFLSVSHGCPVQRLVVAAVVAEGSHLSAQEDWSGGHGDRQGVRWAPSPTERPPHSSTFDGCYSWLTTDVERIKPRNTPGGAFSQEPPPVSAFRLLRTDQGYPLKAPIGHDVAMPFRDTSQWRSNNSTLQRRRRENKHASRSWSVENLHAQMGRGPRPRSAGSAGSTASLPRSQRPGSAPPAGAIGHRLSPNKGVGYPDRLSPSAQLTAQALELEASSSRRPPGAEEAEDGGAAQEEAKAARRARSVRRSMALLDRTAPSLRRRHSRSHSHSATSIGFADGGGGMSVRSTESLRIEGALGKASRHGNPVARGHQPQRRGARARAAAARPRSALAKSGGTAPPPPPTTTTTTTTTARRLRPGTAHPAVRGRPHSAGTRVPRSVSALAQLGSSWSIWHAASRLESAPSAMATHEPAQVTPSVQETVSQVAGLRMESPDTQASRKHAEYEQQAEMLQAQIDRLEMEVATAEEVEKGDAAPASLHGEDGATIGALLVPETRGESTPTKAPPPPPTTPSRTLATATRPPPPPQSSPALRERRAEEVAASSVTSSVDMVAPPPPPQPPSRESDEVVAAEVGALYRARALWAVRGGSRHAHTRARTLAAGALSERARPACARPACALLSWCVFVAGAQSNAAQGSATEHDLEFEAGDVLDVLADEVEGWGDGWGIGRRRDPSSGSVRVGYFPRNFVERLQ